jgi:hypothetical protein
MGAYKLFKDKTLFEQVLGFPSTTTDGLVALFTAELKTAQVPLVGSSKRYINRNKIQVALLGANGKVYIATDKEVLYELAKNQVLKVFWVDSNYIDREDPFRRWMMWEFQLRIGAEIVHLCFATWALAINLGDWMLADNFVKYLRKFNPELNIINFNPEEPQGAKILPNIETLKETDFPIL